MLTLLAILLLIFILRPRYHPPQVFTNFIPSDTCDYIIKRASTKLQPSVISRDKVVDEQTRKSETAWLGTDDRVVAEVMSKCTSVTDRPIGNCEKLQVLRYTPGGFYKPHQDAFKGEKNMRMYTCIIALTDDFEGGETVFPNIHKTYKLKKGDMLLFNTLNDWGWMTSSALHGGNPVTRGEKWICNLWIRTFPYDS